MSEEKRGSQRIYKRFILRAAPLNEQPLRWSYVTIHNLSSTGALFTFDRPVYIGMPLRFKIDFPERVVECIGRVRRLSGSAQAAFQDVGASFEGMRPNDKYYVDDFIQKNG